jgi:choline dehydrogenase-like flavoprotein
MLIDSADLPSGTTLQGDVCIVGSGPAGIILALELARSGLSVILLESGGKTFDSRLQQLGDAQIVDSERHAPLNEATRRQFGGTSAIWGGRCVPLDAVDFERREHAPNSGWPIILADLEEHYLKACEYAGCGPADFSATSALPDNQPGIVPGLPDGTVTSSRLERWGSPTDFGFAYETEIRRQPRISCVLHSTCVSIDFDGNPTLVESITLATPGALSFKARARAYVLACGGLGSTRLLLASNSVHADGIGNHSGQLGRFYMGHVSGKIADVQFFTDPRKTAFGFERDRTGAYCRKRFSVTREHQIKNRVLNCALWLDNPRLYDVRHRSGILSLAYLALATPTLNRYLAPEAIVRSVIGSSPGDATWRHLGNVLRDLPSVALFAPTFVYRRYFARRRIPGFFIGSASNVYALHYHGEHLSDPESRVHLSNDTDDLGMRRLEVDIRFSDSDAASVVNNHRLLDGHLQASRAGRLIYHGADSHAAVLHQARDGFHQIGTTRMSANARDGVVDINCRVHGLHNLYVSSSSVFPTSGQANPTLTVMALSVRLARHLAGTLSRVGHVPSP